MPRHIFPAVALLVVFRIVAFGVRLRRRRQAAQGPGFEVVMQRPRKR